MANATETSHLRPATLQVLAARADRICDHKIANVTLTRGGVSGSGSFGPLPPPLRSSDLERGRTQRIVYDSTLECTPPVMGAGSALATRTDVSEDVSRRCAVCVDCGGLACGFFLRASAMVPGWAATHGRKSSSLSKTSFKPSLM